MAKKLAKASPTPAAKRLIAKREVFLAFLAEKNNVTRACDRAKVARSVVYLWRNSDEEFAKAWERAEEEGKARTKDRIEQSLDEMAIEGVREPIYQGGKLVGHKRVKNVVAAIVRLKKLDPEGYRERSTLDLNVIPNLPQRLDAAERRLKEVKEEE